MQTSGAMDANGIESRDEFRCGIPAWWNMLSGEQEKFYTGNCVAVICLFLWLILYGREINFPSVLSGNRKKICFLDLSSSSGNCQIFWKNVQKVTGVSNYPDLFFGCVRFWYICWQWWQFLAYLRSLRMQGKNKNHYSQKNENFGMSSNTNVNVIFGNRGNYNCSHNGKCDIVISKSYERNRPVFRRMADCWTVTENHYAENTKEERMADKNQDKNQE